MTYWIHVSVCLGALCRVHRYELKQLHLNWRIQIEIQHTHRKSRYIYNQIYICNQNLLITQWPRSSLLGRWLLRYRRIISNLWKHYLTLTRWSVKLNLVFIFIRFWLHTLFAVWISASSVYFSIFQFKYNSFAWLYWKAPKKTAARIQFVKFIVV